MVVTPSRLQQTLQHTKDLGYDPDPLCAVVSVAALCYEAYHSSLRHKLYNFENTNPVFSPYTKS